MVHHDSRSYEVAVSEAAAKGRVKMEEIIQAGLASARSVLEQVQARVVTDRVARANALRVELDDEARYTLGPVTNVSDAGGSYRFDPAEAKTLHPHAQAQLFDAVGVPKKYADFLVKEAGGSTWGKQLVARNVNEVLAHRAKQRHLLRSEGGQLKGFLSDRFRRLDSRPLLDAFMGAANEIGLVPVQGVASDTKCRMRAVMPQVFEPVDNEVILVGVEWGNSDYGDGGHQVSLFMTRVWCTNMAMADQVLKQVHLGKTLQEDIQYSDATYRLDTRANVSALRDVVRHAIGPARVNALMSGIRAASEHAMPGKAVEAFLAKHLDKTDAATVKAMYEGPDVTNLPAGETTWRFSNALSFFANANGVSPDKKLELEKLAGSLVPHVAAKALEV